MLEDPYEYTPEKPLLIIPAILWFISIIFSIGVVLLLTGCATPQEEEVWHRVCYEQFIGKDERGLMVVRHFCVKEEALK